MIKNGFSRLILRATVVLLGCLIAASPGWAFERETRHHQKGAGFGFEFLKQLDLTEAQKSGVAEIMTAYRPQLDTVRGDIHQARHGMRTAMDQTPFNEAQVRAAYQGMSPLLEDMIVLIAKIRSEIRPLLTADQIKTLDEKRAQHHQRKREQQDHCPGMMPLDTDETP